MKNDLYTGSGSSLAGSGSSAASSSSASSMQTSLQPGGNGGAAGNSLSALSGGASGKGSLAIGKSMFYTERPPNEYAASAMGELQIFHNSALIRWLELQQHFWLTLFSACSVTFFFFHFCSFGNAA